MPPSTSRSEQVATYHGQGSLGGETTLDYNIFLTDAFGAGPLQLSFFVDDAVPKEIDGFVNDDAYRASRHYLLRQGSANPSQTDNLRESSLARQLQNKSDQPATIRLIRRIKPEEAARHDPTQGGRQLPWVNLIPPNTKFFLENVIENREEKVQVVDTFGEWIAFFFGRRPEVYSYSGMLLNAKNHNWKDEFQENYDNFLRGSKAVEFGATMFLQYDDVMVEGFMLNCNLQMNAALDKGVPFSFNLLVIARSPLNPRALMAARFARSGGSTAEQQLFQNMQQALKLLTGNAASDAAARDSLATFLLMREFFAGNYAPPAGTAVLYPYSGTLQGQNAMAPGVAGGLATQSSASAPFQAQSLGKLNAAQVTQLTGRDVSQDKTPSIVGFGPPLVA